MKFNIKVLQTILILSATTLLIACGQNDSRDKLSQIDGSTIDQQNLIIDTFSDFPPEIDGCSCYFSNDSNEFNQRLYIYVNDFAETAFLKVCGTLTKFKQVNHKEIDARNVVAKYKSDIYEMTIEVKDEILTGEETSLKTGTITLRDKKGQTIRTTFYGECGC
jgi:catabolite regulation protein CreA